MMGTSRLSAIRSTCAVAVMMVAVQALAQEGEQAYEFKTLDLAMERDALEAVCEHLGLTDGERTLAEALWQEYWDEIVAHDEASHQAVEDAGFRRARELSEEARSRNEPDPLEQMAEIARDWNPVYVQALRNGDERLERLLGDLRSIATHTPNAAWERVPVLIRRLNHESRTRRHDAGRTDFSTLRVFPFELVVAASQPGCELAGLSGDVPPDGIPGETLKIAREEVSAALLSFETTQDAFLRETHDSRRRPLAENYSGRITRDSAEGRAMIASRVPKFAMFNEVVRRLGDVAETLEGVEARTALTERFYREFCPTLYSEYVPDKVYAELVQREDFTESQVPAVDTLYALYRQRLNVLRDRATKAGMLALSRHFSASGTEEEQLRYEAACLQIRDLVAETVPTWYPVLTESQRVAAQDAVDSARLYYARLMGPIVTGEARRLLTGKEPTGWLPPRVDPRTGQYGPPRGVGADGDGEVDDRR